jgi:hypothetical protein
MALTIKHKSSGKNGREIYLVYGSAKELADYRELTGDALIEDDETGRPLYFLYKAVFDGTVIKYNEERDRFYPVETVQSKMLSQAIKDIAREMLMGGSVAGSSSSETSDESDADDAELEEETPAPKAKPAAKPKRRIS